MLAPRTRVSSGEAAYPLAEIPFFASVQRISSVLSVINRCVRLIHVREIEYLWDVWFSEYYLRSQWRCLSTTDEWFPRIRLSVSRELWWGEVFTVESLCQSTLCEQWFSSFHPHLLQVLFRVFSSSGTCVYISETTFQCLCPPGRTGVTCDAIVIPCRNKERCLTCYTASIHRLMFQSIKCKQDRKIMKKLIGKHKVEQSMRRFIRIYRCHDGTLLGDDMNVVSSCPTEESGRNQLDDRRKRVRHILPREGPINGGTEIKVVMQGIEVDDRDKVSIIVWENNMPRPIPREDVQWNEQTASFEMPTCQWSQEDQVVVNIRIYHNEKELDGSTHQYSKARKCPGRTENLFQRRCCPSFRDWC